MVGRTPWSAATPSSACRRGVNAWYFERKAGRRPARTGGPPHQHSAQSSTPPPSSNCPPATCPSPPPASPPPRADRGSAPPALSAIFSPLAKLQLPACNLPVAPAGEPADQNSDTIPQGSPKRALLFATTPIISFCKPAQWP